MADFKFIIFSPSYHEDIGGIIVLHKLCHTLNKLGYSAFIYPSFNTFFINKKNWFSILIKFLRNLIRDHTFPPKLNPDFVTPLFKFRDRDINDSYIVIYPESIIGNPLNAKNIVRWFLYYPGRQEEFICYGKNELYFDFNAFSDGLNIPGSTLSREKLYLMHFPLNLYNLNHAFPSHQRIGVAYCIRKGKGKALVHDANTSILIDGKSHIEISNIFKQVKTFISYDTKTAYSFFAALCGANSIVIPDPGVSKSDCFPDERDSYGIAYGFEDLDWAVNTRSQLLPYIEKVNAEATAQVKNFATTSIDFFQNKDS